jgi:predicted amidophosphoribosyltransferase
MICQQCGAYIPEGDYHCEQCGAPVLQPEPETGQKHEKEQWRVTKTTTVLLR